MLQFIQTVFLFIVIYSGFHQLMTVMFSIGNDIGGFHYRKPSWRQLWTSKFYILTSGLTIHQRFHICFHWKAEIVTLYKVCFLTK